MFTLFTTYFVTSYFLETSVTKETTSSLKPSFDSHFYASNVANTAAYPVVTPSPIIVPTNVRQGRQI
jgi:hypothetical protein